jgi:EmrB/QacA subfamily drug resistance transporter
MKAPRQENSIRSSASAGSRKNNSAPWILAATVLGSSMAFIDGTVVNVAVPTLQAAFHATVVDVQWVIESYGILLSCLILAGGALGDIYGRRLIFLTGVVIFAAASAACGLAPSIHLLVMARCIQGVGAALLVPGSLAIISASFEEKSRGKAIGTWSGFTAITTALGPLLGGWLIQYGSWRWVFFLNVPIAFAVLLISLWQVPESRGVKTQHLDWAGALLATAGLAGMVTGFLESQRWGWSNFLTLGSLLGGIACLAVFLFAESRVAAPMIPFSLFNSRVFAGANLITFFLYAAIGMFFFLFPMELIQVRGYSTSIAGAAMLPMILSMFLLSRWSGGLVHRYGAKLPLIIGPLVVASGFLLFAFLPATKSYWTTFFPASLLLGFGMAITVAPLTTAVMDSVAQDRAGTASGINNAVARVAGVLAIAIFGIVLIRVFSYFLDHSLATLPLAPNVRQAIRAKEIELAGLQLPALADAHQMDVIRVAVSSSFVSAFHVVLYCCAGLAGGSALISWRMIAPIGAAARPVSGAPAKRRQK